ncbi:hypothetical protein PRUB_a3499 [Pseudoalteromonas rubra]|uniref:Uncharacterized protein n=1 Tax=Pseudoalteromonas rubra TaxID=43658 RepID=A0A8T0C4Z4_9GAMM|nr:hypothetical protein PRUB_a3499 [Pseudoalteromonas rubra]
MYLTDFLGVKTVNFDRFKLDTVNPPGSGIKKPPLIIVSRWFFACGILLFSDSALYLLT